MTHNGSSKAQPVCEPCTVLRVYLAVPPSLFPRMTLRATSLPIAEVGDQAQGGSVRSTTTFPSARAQPRLSCAAGAQL